MDDYSDLIGETPTLARDVTLELPDLGGPGAELSTGLILTWRNKLVFGLDPDAIPLGAQGRPDVRAFVGIGGHLDPGESWSQAVTREAQEEASCLISLGDSPVTYWCRLDGAPRPIIYHWDEPCRPLLVWTAVFMLRRGSQRQRIPVTIVSAIFRAAALTQPAANAEISALILMDPETLLHTYTAPRPVSELLARGAQIIGDVPAPQTLLAPGGSAYFCAQWLAWQEERPRRSGDSQ
jgi:8-oxo-dGTP pyrophosphatase MutT (NUDIX family)